MILNSVLLFLLIAAQIHTFTLAYLKLSPLPFNILKPNKYNNNNNNNDISINSLHDPNIAKENIGDNMLVSELGKPRLNDLTFNDLNDSCTEKLNKTLDIFTRFTNFSKLFTTTSNSSSSLSSDSLTPLTPSNSINTQTNALKVVKSFLDKLQTECDFMKIENENIALDNNDIIKDSLVDSGNKNLDCQAYLQKIENMNDMIKSNRNNESNFFKLLYQLQYIINNGVEKCEEAYKANNLNNPNSNDIDNDDQKNIQLIFGRMNSAKFKNHLNH